jgi:short-subunit dehydrogenase
MKQAEQRARTKTALVTGASSGLGLEFSKLLARDGYHLVIVARDAAKLQQVADELAAQHKITVRVIARDLSAADAGQAIYDELRRDSVVVDVLINNAGYALYGPFIETDLDTEVRMIGTNVTTLTILSKLFARDMVRRRRGRILNVASTAAFVPGPLMAVYYATKAYVLSFSEALANELQGTGVTVTALCPGPTETGFQQRAQMEGSRLVAGRKIAGAAEVAAAGYRAMLKGQTMIIPGLRNQLQTLSVRFSPRTMVAQVVRRMQERTH